MACKILSAKGLEVKILISKSLPSFRHGFFYRFCLGNSGLFENFAQGQMSHRSCGKKEEPARTWRVVPSSRARKALLRMFFCWMLRGSQMLRKVVTKV